MKEKSLIVITGPTASGKSALAVEVARRLNTQIISADSRQIYKGIPIVTAVPSEEERGGVRHHLLEILDLNGYYSASEFEQDALRISSEIFKNSDYAVVCGGSMMYVDALCNGIDELPTVPDYIRRKLMDDWQREGDDWLLAQLATVDPLHYEKVDRRNLKRVFHAIEVSIAAGEPYSSLLTGIRRERPFRILKICLDGEREELFGRINRRVLDMMTNGLEAEARAVEHLRHLNSLNTVGLKEMFAYFDGLMSKEVAIARIQKNTRVYAKKQMTWHKRDKEMKRLDFSNPIIRNCESILELLRS